MKIRFIVYPGFDLLDLSGPLEVFAEAGAFVPHSYDIEVLSAAGGAVQGNSGISVLTRKMSRPDADILIVVGGAMKEIDAASLDIARLLEKEAGRTRRIASICTGAFMLGHAGLLDGRRATTHWRRAAELQARFPACKVDADKIFIQDGPIWTSAGVAAGIDLALALVEEDLGLAVSRQVARELVVYQRRPGGQSQFSALLELEPASDRVKQALAFARSHLHEELSVPRLAEVAHLSPRQFSRAFLAETGMSPAKAVERLRAEAAKPLIEDSRKSLDVIAREVGFCDPERMRQAFVRAYGQPPQSLRRQSRAARVQ